MLMDSMKEKRGWLESEDEIEVDEARREFLARKGKILYGKFCGTDGRGICAESFAEYHLWLGEVVIVRDFLVFLHEQRELLQEAPGDNPELQIKLELTVDLIERIEAHLGEKERLPA
jgi:hypothetical protein